MHTIIYRHTFAHTCRSLYVHVHICADTVSSLSQETVYALFTEVTVDKTDSEYKNSKNFRNGQCCFVLFFSLPFEYLINIEGCFSWLIVIAKELVAFI